MERDLIAAIEEAYRGETSAIMMQHKKFALTNRQRGAQILDELIDNAGFDVADMLVLDVGCAYAGFVIEAAARGARAWGVEINTKLVRMAELNAGGEPGKHTVVHGDFLAPEVVASLPDSFDLVLLNDVFEHIYDTATLLSQVDAVTAPGAALVFAIPNGDCVDAVAREGHLGVPGISLLPANWWHAVVPQFTAFYRPWRYYAALLRAFGFEQISIWDPDPNLTLDAARERVAAGLERAKAAVTQMEYRDERARPIMEQALGAYCDQVEDDLAGGDHRLLSWRYLTDFWRGVATKTSDGGERLELPGEWVRRRRQRFSPGADVTYEPVELSFSPRQLKTRWNQRAECTIEADGEALRCTVVASERGRKGHYGGLRLPVRTPLGLRIDIEFVDPQNIEAVYVDAYSLWRSRALRWLWRASTHNEKPSLERESFELAPGQRWGPFAAIDPVYPEMARDIHLFVRVRPGTSAGFVLHRLEVASASSASSMRASSSV